MDWVREQKPEKFTVTTGRGVLKDGREFRMFICAAPEDAVSLAGCEFSEIVNLGSNPHCRHIAETRLRKAST